MLHSCLCPYWVCHCVCWRHWCEVTWAFCFFFFRSQELLHCLVWFLPTYTATPMGELLPFSPKTFLCVVNRFFPGYLSWLKECYPSSFFPLHCLLEPGLTLTSREVFIRNPTLVSYQSWWFLTPCLRFLLLYNKSLPAGRLRLSISARLYCNLKKMQICLSCC